MGGKAADGRRRRRREIRRGHRPRSRFDVSGFGVFRTASHVSRGRRHTGSSVSTFAVWGKVFVRFDFWQCSPEWLVSCSSTTNREL
jgi:hypothetical protein